MPFKSEKQRRWMHANKPKMAKKWEKKKEAVEEKKERDYKDEYKKFQSSPKAKKYRAELNKYNRKKGTYGNGDGKDASHKGGKIVGFESQSKNRGRAEKSRLKKESLNEREMSIKDAFKDLVKDHGAKKALDMLADVLTGGALAAMDPKKVKAFKKKLLKKVTTEAKLNENPAAIAAAQRMVVQSKSGKVSVNTARQSSYAKKDPSTHKKAKSMWQRIKDKFSKKENMSEKVNPEMKKIYKLLLKYGNSERDAAKMIKKNYDYVAKTYKGTTPRNKAVVLVGLQAMGESINEAFAIQYKKDKRYLTRKELFDKKPLKFKTEDEAKSMLNGLDHKYRTNYKIVKIKEGSCGYGVDGKLGEEPAGPHLIKKKKKLIKSKVQENKDPDIISQLRGVLKKGYSSVKDPVSGKKMKVDTYTASAITKVYDAINTSNKKKFSKLPLLKMQSIAMKFVK